MAEADHTSDHYANHGHVRSTSKAASDAASAASLLPSAPLTAIQGMLRNQTELGDIVLRSTPRSQRSYSSSRIRHTKRRSASFDSSIDTCRSGLSSIPHDPFQRRHRSRQVRPQATSHSLRAALAEPIIQTRPFRSRPPPLGRQSRNHARFGPSRQPLHNHKSLTALRSYSHRQIEYGHSPVWHHSYVENTPYQDRSFAEHATSEYHNACLLPGFHRSRESIRSPSTLPAWGDYQTDGHQPRISVSQSPMLKHRSPSVGSSLVTSVHTPLSARNRTPNLLSPTMATFELAGDNTYPHVGSASPASSISPEYYDYSESFLEEGANTERKDLASVLEASCSNRAVHDYQTVNRPRARTPFGTRSGSVFHPAELPTKHNRRPSERSVVSSLVPIPERDPCSGLTSDHPPVSSIIVSHVWLHYCSRIDS